MIKRLSLIAALGLAASCCYGAGQAHGGAGYEQPEEMFSREKQARMEGIQDRIAILKTALRCVNRAADHAQMSACDQQERQSMGASMQQNKNRMETMRPAGGRGAQGIPPPR